MTIQTKVRTCLWFESNGREAVEFYVSLLADSRVETAFTSRDDKPMVVDFTLAGTPYQILNGGPHFKLNEAASISVLTIDQIETDRLWKALIANGGSESRCGWLKDRFGLSWQIVPIGFVQMMKEGNPDQTKNVMEAMMGMNKLDVAKLEAAYVEIA